MRPEIDWDWAAIFVIAMAKLAPAGCELNIDDVVGLPMEKVLITHRTADYIDFSWASVEEGRALAGRRVLIPGEERASVSRLEGRYMKLASILLWKLAKAGVRLRLEDLERVPRGQFLFEDGIEYKWLPVAEGLRLARSEAEHEGRERIISRAKL